MKKLLFSFSLFLMAMTYMSAQTVLGEGYIKMEIVDATSDDEQMAMGLEMMKGTQTEIFFMGGKSLSKVNMMGGMVETTTLFNSETEQMDMLFNMMGQKMHVSSTAAERALAQNEQAALAKEMEVTYDESDTKEILGYNCVKANIAHPSIQDGMSFSMYITKDIKADPKMIQGLQDIKIEGFPLEYVMSMPQMTMTISAVELKQEVDASVFDLDTGGYEKLTLQEFTDRMKQFGGGGFGF
ncbi:MAG: hypothetical protein HKN68_18500 [Saprospiraceae bacterium]|nr:hypothetical protein [Saprospiraceae bacterium]